MVSRPEAARDLVLNYLPPEVVATDSSEVRGTGNGQGERGGIAAGRGDGLCKARRYGDENFGRAVDRAEVSDAVQCRGRTG